MDSKIIKKELEEIGKKYNLPVRELDRELELTDYFVEKNEMSKFPARVIRRRLLDIFYSWSNYLHSFLFPNPQSIIATRDSEAFDEKEKDEIYKIIARLAKMTRGAVELELRKEESGDAEFVRNNFEEFKKIKKQIEPFTKKNKEFWEKESGK